MFNSTFINSRKLNKRAVRTHCITIIEYDLFWHYLICNKLYLNKNNGNICPKTPRVYNLKLLK